MKLQLCIAIASFFIAQLQALPLFDRYPHLHDHIAHVTLGDFPTPLSICATLSEAFGCTLYCKHEEYAGSMQENGTRLFGGNKVRKLEFVLADAVKKGAETILTFGCAGSNHALATSLYAQQLGLDVICLLAHQPTSWVVQRNLLMQQYYGAELHYFDTIVERRAAARAFVDSIFEQTGKAPYVIPPGASMSFGVLGFINAIFELDLQMASMPDFIYVPSSSLGTTVGLLMGLQLIDAPTRVIGVSVETEPYLRADAERLFMETRNLLISCDPSFASLTWRDEQFILYDQFYGDGYGCPTAGTQEAQQLFAQENIILEDTYTAKAAAALVHDAKAGMLANKTVLFWMTFYNDPATEIVEKASYEKLPEPFHKYFEK